MFTNNRHSYGSISKSLHWLSAALVIGLLILGHYITGLDNEKAWYYQCLDLHQTTGIVIWLLICLTLLWRLVTAPPQALPETSPWLNQLRWLVHNLLKLSLFIQPILGYLSVTSHGDPIEIYELMEIPALIELSKSSSELIVDLHTYLAYSLAALIMLHALAALKHHYIDRDNVLKRML